MWLYTTVHVYKTDILVLLGFLFIKNLPLALLVPNCPKFKPSINTFVALYVQESTAILCSMVGRYDNPIPIRFLAPTDCSKIPFIDQFNSDDDIWLWCLYSQLVHGKTLGRIEMRIEKFMTNQNVKKK
jgi:hypothetical protein